MATLTSFLPYILAYVPGCSTPLAEQYIRDVAIDFCVNTAIAQVTCDPISVRAGKLEYDVDVDSGLKVHHIVAGWYESRPLHVFKSVDGVNRAELYNTKFRNAQSTTGSVQSVKQGPDNTVLLNAAPATDSPYALTLIVSVKPTRTAASVPDILFDDYADAIAQGVVSRLMQIPNTNFSSPTWAQHDLAYRKAKAEARIRAAKSFGPAETRIKFRRF